MVDHVADRLDVDRREGLERQEVGQVGKLEEPGALLPQVRPVGVGHASGELEALVDAVSLFLLHADSVVLGLGVLLGIRLVHRDFTDDLVSQLRQDSVKEELDVFTGLGGFLLNPLDNLPALLLLGLEEVVDVLVLLALARIHEPVVAHVEHELAVLEQVLAEVVPQDEELLVKGVYRLHLVV